MAIDVNTMDRLVATIGAVCPIVGVSANQGAVQRIEYDASASQAQRDAADAAASGFDWSPAATSTWVADQAPERRDLRAAATQAIADLDAFLAIVSPTNAQVVAAVKKLAQQNRAVIKRLIQVE